MADLSSFWKDNGGLIVLFVTEKEEEEEDEYPALNHSTTKRFKISEWKTITRRYSCSTIYTWNDDLYRTQK